MAEKRAIFLGWQLPAGLYTTDGAENKAGMRRGDGRVTPHSRKSHDDAGRKNGTHAALASVTDVTWRAGRKDELQRQDSAACPAAWPTRLAAHNGRPHGRRQN